LIGVRKNALDCRLASLGDRASPQVGDNTDYAMWELLPWTRSSHRSVLNARANFRSSGGLRGKCVSNDDPLGTGADGVALASDGGRPAARKTSARSPWTVCDLPDARCDIPSPRFCLILLSCGSV